MHRIHQAGLLPLWFLLLVPGFATAAGPPPVAKKPNILFLSLDDLRPELGCYGADHVISPNIDKLATQGVTFTRAYCQQAICNPSRASLLTGYYPDQIRVWDLPTHFRETAEGVVTLPQNFKDHGYYSVFAGKIFHPGHEDPPSWNEPALNRQAKSWWRQYSDPVEKKFKRLRAEAEKKGESLWKVWPPAMEAVPDSPDHEWVDGVMADLAIKKLRELATKEQPFFLGVGLSQTHLPFTCPKRYWDLYDPATIPVPQNSELPRNVPPMALNTAAFLHTHADLRERGVGPVQNGPMPEDLARQLRHGYLACTSFLDAQVGRVIDELDRLGLRENTIICLWGDHGWKLGEHQGWSKMTNFEIDTRCPLIICSPALGKSANRKCEAIVEFVDLYPTLADLAGLGVPPNLPGKTLRPLLENPDAEWNNAALSQYLRGGMIAESYDGKMHMGYTMRTREFRYTEWYAWDPKRKIAGQLEARELYDHRENNLEAENVAGRADYKEPLETMSRQLVEKRAAIAATPGPRLKTRQTKGNGVDLRSEFAKRGLVVRHQGKRGSCQVFGMVGVMEYHLSMPGKPIDLSEQFLMWAANKARGISRVEGFNPDLLVMGLRRYGICREELMPYIPRPEAIKKPSREADHAAGTNKQCLIKQIKHWSDDLGFHEAQIEEICSHLDKGEPVSATFCWPFDLPDDEIVDAEHFLIDRKVQVDKNGHGVIIVGYHRDPAIPGGGYFLIRNSWGASFGDCGYAKVSFAYAGKYGTDAYRVTINSL